MVSQFCFMISSKIRLEIFPVEISNSFSGTRLSKCVSRKSRSLVIKDVTLLHTDSSDFAVRSSVFQWQITHIKTFRFIPANKMCQCHRQLGQ